MFVYHQDTGLFARDGLAIANGYSGYPPHVNVPDSEALHGLGPIPRGYWTIGPAYAHATLGPVTMNLTPAGGIYPHDRNLFRIHGDRVAAPGFASHGCIILPRTAREMVALSPDRELRVCLEAEEDEGVTPVAGG